MNIIILKKIKEDKKSFKVTLKFKRFLRFNKYLKFRMIKL